MMTKQKPRLYRNPNYDDKEELRISGKSLLLLFFLTVGFFILAFICKGPTYGVLQYGC